jgi:uncharacterized protein YceK
MMARLIIILATSMLLQGCASVYVVTISPDSKHLSDKFEEFYKKNGFVNCVAQAEKQFRWCQDMIDRDNSLNSIWLQPGKAKPYWDRGINLFEHKEQNNFKIRLVFQRGGNERAAEKRAADFAKELKAFITEHDPGTVVKVVEQRSPDLR